MGCWNGTCFLSNLSIRHGDKIKLQLLVPRCYGRLGHSRDSVDLDAYKASDDPRDINGVTYINGAYAPLAPAITGEYNDYGSIENVEDNDALKFLKQYVKSLVKQEDIVSLRSVDTWLYRDREKKNQPTGLKATIPVNVDDIDAFINIVERGSIIIKSPYSGWVRLRFVMMHDDIYQSGVDMVNKWTVYGEDKTLKQAWAVKQKEIVNYYANGDVPIANKNDDDTTKLLHSMVDTFKELMKKAPTDEEKNNLQAVINEQEGLMASSTLWIDFHYDEHRLYCHRFIHKYCANNKQLVSGFVKEMYQNLAMTQYLGKLRKPWMVTGGGGSQDDNEECVAAHSKAVMKFVKEYMKE